MTCMSIYLPNCTTDKPPRPTKPPRPPSISKGSRLDLPPSDPAAEPVFVPPPPPEIPPSPDGEQEDVSRLIEMGRLNRSFDDGADNEECGEGEMPPPPLSSY